MAVKRSSRQASDSTINFAVWSVPTEPAPEPLEHARYWYDGDGMMVKGQVNDTVT